MKINLDNVNLSARTGPNTFASRLARELLETGHELVSGPEADVSLVFIEPSGQPLAKTVVQRLDGVWFKPSEFYTKNQAIKRQYEAADGIVFQSEFDKAFVERWWGHSYDKTQHYRGHTSRPHYVIRNGIDLHRINRVTIPELLKIRASNDKVFVCSSNWHPQKRLKANLQLFDHLRKTQFPNSCLFVMGAHPDVMTTDPRVLYTGPQPSEVYLQVFAVADWMLHLAWADHCPNVVIEALSQGTPVACSEVGGTKELIGDYGLILKETPYDYALADYDSPPSIDVTQVEKLPNRNELSYGSIANIDIKHVAQQYVNLFKELV